MTQRNNEKHLTRQLKQNGHIEGRIFLKQSNKKDLEGYPMRRGVIVADGT